MSEHKYNQEATPAKALITQHSSDWAGTWGYSEGGVHNTTIDARRGSLEDFIEDLRRGEHLAEKDGPYVTCSDCGGRRRNKKNATHASLLALDFDGVPGTLLETLCTDILKGHVNISHNTFSDGDPAKGYSKLLEAAWHPKISNNLEEHFDELIEVAELAGLNHELAEALVYGSNFLAYERSEENLEALHDAASRAGIAQLLPDGDVAEALLKRFGKTPRPWETVLKSLRWSGPNGERLRVYIPLTRLCNRRELQVLNGWLMGELRSTPGGTNVDACGASAAQAMYTMRRGKRVAFASMEPGPVLNPDALPNGRSVGDLLQGPPTQSRHRATPQRAKTQRSSSPERAKTSTFASEGIPLELDTTATFNQATTQKTDFIYECPPGSFDVSAWLKRHGIDAQGPSEWEEGGVVWRLDCPWREQRDPKGGYIVQFPDGRIFSACHHDTCPGSKKTGNHWKEVQALFEERCIDAAITQLTQARSSEERASALKAFACAVEGWPRIDHAQQAALKSMAIDAAKSAGIPAPTQTIHGIIKQASQAAPTLQTTTQTTLAIHSVLGDAPVPQGYTIPANYTLDNRRTTHHTLDRYGQPRKVDIAHAPILIAGRATARFSNSERIKVAWKRDGKWNEYAFNRSDIADTRSIAKVLADRGIPVTSLHNAELVEYLSKSEAHNLDILPHALVTHQMGWTHANVDKNTSFLWGHQRITTEGIDPNPTPDQSIIFQATDDGNKEIASAFHSKGSAKQWWEIAKQAAEHPRAVLMVCSALAPPLLPIFGCVSFGIECAGPTSRGKSTAQEWAASIWGQPRRGLGASTVHSWDATKVGLERTAVLLNDLPFILDDTKSARNPHVVGDMVYAYTSGRGRLRGSKTGLAGAGSWRGIMISSGERPIWTFARGSAGIRGRVVQLQGAVFTGETDQMRRLAESIRVCVTHHYGHLGPTFVRYILNNHERWPAWQKDFRSLQEELASRAAGKSPIAGRLAEPYALLMWVARQLVHLAPAGHWPEQSTALLGLWDELVMELVERDTATEAMRHVYDWCVSHRQQFEEKGAFQQHEPHGGWAGRWDQDDSSLSIYMVPQKLDKVLEQRDFTRDEVWPVWLERSWVRPQGNRRGRKRKLGGQQIRLIWITSKAIADVLGDGAVEGKD